jgi:6-phosphofructokinase
MMKYHPLADIFPLIEGVEFDELVTSIKENGQQHAIVTIDDSILDGRNRYRACLSAGVDPRFEVFTGSDPIKFVIDINIRRRHLNESQRAMIAAKLATLAPGQHPTARAGEISPAAISSTQAAAMLNVNRHTVNHARKVMSEGTPEEVKAVQEGKAAVSTIAKQIRAEVSNIQRKKMREQELSQSGRNPERIQKMQMDAQVWAQLSDALNNLSMLPLPADVSLMAGAQAKRRLLVDAKLAQSLSWLKDFSDAWSNRDQAAA